METLFNLLPDWAKKKLVIRMVYTAASFITAHIVAFLSGPTLDHGWGVVVSFGGAAGIPLAPNLLTGPIDSHKLEVYIAGLLMVGSEWVIQHVHDNHVVPVVAPAQQAAAQAIITEAPSKGE